MSGRGVLTRRRRLRRLHRFMLRNWGGGLGRLVRRRLFGGLGFGFGFRLGLRLMLRWLFGGFRRCGVLRRRLLRRIRRLVLRRRGRTMLFASFFRALVLVLLLLPVLFFVRWRRGLRDDEASAIAFWCGLRRGCGGQHQHGGSGKQKRFRRSHRRKAPFAMRLARVRSSVRASRPTRCSVRGSARFGACDDCDRACRNRAIKVAAWIVGGACKLVLSMRRRSCVTRGFWRRRATAS